MAISGSRNILAAGMNILELNFERTWRGGERQTLYNMEGFRDKGISVCLLCRKGYPLEAKAMEAGFTVFSFNNVFGVLFFLLTKGKKYNVLHAQTSHILTYCVLAKPFHRARIIFSRRVSFMPHGRLTRLKYKATDYITAVSKAVKEVLEQFGAQNIAVISDVVEKKELDKKRALTFLKDIKVEGKYIVGTIAAMGNDKDPLTMVEAIHKLSQLRTGFIFLHFGDGPLQPALQNKITEYGLQDVYKLMGFQSEIEDFYSLFDVFVMSSRHEGLGSSVLDAFLYKVPVVSTNAGGLRDLLENNRGVSCNVADFNALATGIDLVLYDRELSKEMAEHAYDYAFSAHNQKYITNQYLQLLDSK